MSENKYTAEDFANVEFATKNGLFAACRSRSGFWRTESGVALVDRDMAEKGWVPVPSSPAKPTITAGEVGRRSHLVRGGNVETPSLVDFLEALGIEVVPDPVPTNAELLARDLDELNRDGFLIHNRHKEMIANLLIERGWTKTPEANDDL